jgi:hypothetical protein
VREDVEPVDRAAPRVVPLLAGLAVDGGGDRGGGLRQRDQPPREGAAELLEGEARQGAAEGRGVGRLLAGEAQGAFEDPPAVGRPPPEAGEIGPAAEQAEERQGEDRGVRVADAPRLTGVVDLGEGVEQPGERGGHP